MNVAPAPDLTPLNEPPARARQRLSDAIDEAFHVALSRGDLATAEELLSVLHAMRDRERVRSRGDRRRGDLLLERAQRELEAKKAVRYRRY